MSLADDLAAAAAANPYAGRCKFCAWVDTLSAEDEALVIEAVVGPVAGSALAVAFQRHGCPSDHQTVQRHKRGQCQTWNRDRAG